MLSLSNRIFLGLVLSLAFLTAIAVFLPQGNMIPTQSLPAPKPVIAMVSAISILIIYGGLGWLGLYLSRKLGFKDIWNSDVSNRQRFLVPMMTGAAAGIFMIAADAVFSRFHSLGRLPHPPFPTSIIASATAGIGEEIVFRLFFISFWVWIISALILKNRWQGQVYWAVSVMSALAFAFGHLPAVMMLYGFRDFSAMPPALVGELILLNGVVAIACAYNMRRYGFLAAVGVHFWADILWHVVYGLFQ
jgi:hypothetical protein